MYIMPNPGDQQSESLSFVQTETGDWKPRERSPPRTPGAEELRIAAEAPEAPWLPPLKEDGSKSHAQLAKTMTTKSSYGKKREAREVQIEMCIRRVFKLDTVSQSFGVQLLVVTTWPLTPQEILERPPPGEDEDDINWTPKWVPGYRIKSVLEVQAHEVHFRVKESNGQIYAVQEAHHRVNIFERLELQSFPHDCQELTIELESTLPTGQVRWVPSEDENCIQLSKDRCYLDDFELLHEFPFTWCFELLKFQHKQVPGLKVILYVVRNANFYMINVAFVTFVLCSLVLTTWSMNPSDLEARLTLDFTLVLTVIAFKLILLGMLPRVSYMTQLDKYVMAGFLFLICATMSHAILPMFFFDKRDVSDLTFEPEHFPNEDKLLDADIVSFYVFASYWVIFNVLWGLNFRKVGNRERERFVDEAREQQEGFNNFHKSLLSDAALARLEGLARSQSEYSSEQHTPKASEGRPTARRRSQ
jgi:hypothetical protein